MVSVITLTYKHYDKLLNTISSILDQDWPEFEYIISDDGSGDFPEQLVTEYVKKNKKDNLKNFALCINEHNLGTVKHLNSVIKMCKGEYIFDLSAEDVFVDEHVITRMVETFREEDCDVLFVSRLEYKNGKISGICPHYFDRKKIYKLNNTKDLYSSFLRTEHFDTFIGPNFFYKKSVIEKNGYFDENYKLLEDAPMIGKVLWNEKVAIRLDIFSVIYECKSGVSAPGSKNKLLADDIRYYNQYGKSQHLEELDRKTRNHVRFGIEREKASSPVSLFFICMRYLPRLVDHTIYQIGRVLSGVGDWMVFRKVKKSKYI